MARSLLTKAAALGHPTSKSTRNGARARRWPLALLAASWVVPSHQALAARSCEAWHAEVVGVEGRVEVQRAASPEWSAVEQGAQVCTGDSIRVQTGRATVRLPDQSVLRLDASTTLTFEQSNNGFDTLVDLLRGALHIISRDPRSLKFSTPYANAGLEGTEFDLRVDSSRQQTSVAVLEGQVAFSTAAGEIGVPSGHSAAARAGEMPTVQALAEPVDLMRWASYYPPILDRGLPAPDETISGTATGAAELYAARAAARLKYGRVDAAEHDLSSALSIDAGNSTARALQSIIALARNDRDDALRLAHEAVGTAPQSAAPLLDCSNVNVVLASSRRTL
jgi:hypothetical protein